MSVLGIYVCQLVPEVVLGVISHTESSMHCHGVLEYSTVTAKYQILVSSKKTW